MDYGLLCLKSIFITIMTTTIYVACLKNEEEGTEPPYKAFRNYDDAQAYCQTELPLDLGLEEGDLKENEEFVIYNVELED